MSVMSSLLSDPERTHVREVLGITGRLRASQAGCGRTQNPVLSTPSGTLNLPRKSGQTVGAIVLLFIVRLVKRA